MRPMSKRSFRWLVVVAIAGVVVAHPRPAATFSGSIHSRATRNALPFLGTVPRMIVVSGNLDEDQGDEADLAERHAQNCRFRDSAKYINMRYRQVIDALRDPQPNDPNRAPRLFGHILHGLQDFYSHSNWIPTPPQGLGLRNRLLDAGLGEWPVWEPYSNIFDDVAVVEGDAPAGITVRLPTDASGKVSSAVPIIVDRRIFATTGKAAAKSTEKTYRGVMTSGAPRHPGDQLCPLVAEKCDVASTWRCSVNSPARARKFSPSSR